MFIKKDHYDDKFFIILMITVCIIVACVVIPNFIIKFAVLIFILLLSYTVYKKMKDTGIYVNGKDIIIKRLGNQKKISVENISAIAIVKSVYRGKYKCSDLKDSNGNQLYTILLLSDHKAQMYDYQHGDFTFMIEFKDDIIADCILDEDFVEWLLAEKPQIKIIDNRK